MLSGHVGCYGGDDVPGYVYPILESVIEDHPPGGGNDGVVIDGVIGVGVGNVFLTYEV